MDIFDRISYIISNEGVTIAEFSRKIGIGDQTIRSMLEKRKSFPSFKVIHGICNTYDNYSARWIVTGKGNIMERLYNSDTQSVPEMNEEQYGYSDKLFYKLDKSSVDELIKTNSSLAKCVKEFTKYCAEIKDILDNNQNKK